MATKLVSQEPFDTRHGGSLKKGQRKEARPLDTESPVHITLHSSRAKGAWSFRRPAVDEVLRAELRTRARDYGIKIFEFVNGGSHVHILVHAKSRTAFQGFLRVFAGMVPRRITGARKGKQVGKFWDGLAFTRVVPFGDEFLALRRAMKAQQARTTGACALCTGDGVAPNGV
jgi:REP element-mobilizing transposase RayT